MRTRRTSAFSPVEDLQMRFVLDQQIFVDGRGHQEWPNHFRAREHARSGIAVNALMLYQRYGRRLVSSRFINRLSYERSVRVK